MSTHLSYIIILCIYDWHSFPRFSHKILAKTLYTSFNIDYIGVGKMNTDERLTYIDLSNLYNQTNSSLQVEPGDLAQSIMKMYNIKPVTAFTIVTDAPDPRFRYIIHVNEDDELIQKFNELLDETSDYLEAANKILQENKDLIALIIFDGYDVGISFAKI